MKVSLEWVRDYVDLPADLDVRSLAHELTLKTVEVEDWVDTAAPVAHVVAAEVTAVDAVEGGFRVVCDSGRGEPVSVAVRKTDVTAGELVALAEPGARLAAVSGSTPREVKTATVLGFSSGGVLCGPRDVGLQAMFPEDRERTIRLDPATAKPGDALADVLDLRDTVLDIDNKSLTNRPDLWGHYGIAREFAAIYDLPLAPLPTAAWPGTADGIVGEIEPDACRRFAAVPFDADALPATPMWIRSRLARIGENSVNLCVDMSNYVMFATGQPTHVYDAGKVELPLSVRRLDEGAKVRVIGGTTVDVPAGTPVIADAEGPVGLAGVIGGADSSVTAGSSRFVLEAGSFRARPVRRTTQQLGLRTEASARFEKNVDTERVTAAVGLFLHLLAEVAPDASVHSGQDVVVEATEPTEILVAERFLASRVGTELDPAEVHRTLTALGFAVAEEDGALRVTSPTWRSTGDVSLPHDILEEVARIHGYDNIPMADVHVTLNPVRELHWRPLDRIVREQLAARAGMQEVVTYPWVADHLLFATGHTHADTIRIEGAPAPDRASLRPSLVPNLLEAAAGNLRFLTEFSLYELGIVFESGDYVATDEHFEPLPVQRRLLAGVVVGADGKDAFFQAKGILEMLRGKANLTGLEFTGGDAPAWADGQVRIGLSVEGRQVGSLALVSNKVRRVAGIQAQVACFELDAGLLSAHASRENVYDPVPEFPDADFDLSVVVSDSVVWTDMASTVGSAHALVHDVAFVDEFRGSWVPAEHRVVTLRVTLRSAAATLTADEIAAGRQAVLAALDTAHGARLREV